MEVRGRSEKNLVKVGFLIYICSILVSKAWISIGIVLMSIGFFIGIKENIKKIQMAKIEYKMTVIFILLYTFYDLITPGFINSFIIEIGDFYKIIPLFIMPLYISNELEIKKYLNYMVVSFGIVSLINILKYNNNWRLGGFIGITNTGHVSSLILVLLVGLIMVEENKKYKFFQLIIFSIGFYMMVLTGTRGAIIGSIFSIVIQIIMKYKFKSIILILLLLLAFSLTFQKIKKFTNFEIDKIKTEVSSNTRIEMWKVSLKNLKENSNFFGSGTGRDSLSRAFDKNRELNPKTLIEPKFSGNPHSTYFLILSEKGIYIFLLYIGLFLVYIPWKIYLSRKKFIWFNAIIFSYVTYFISALTEDNWRTMMLRNPYLIILIIWFSFNEFSKE